MGRRRIFTCLDNIRNERESMLQYLGTVIENFSVFVDRPDPKQEYIYQWQMEFNKITDDIRLRFDYHKSINPCNQTLPIGAKNFHNFLSFGLKIDLQNFLVRELKPFDRK